MMCLFERNILCVSDTKLTNRLTHHKRMILLRKLINSFLTRSYLLKFNKHFTEKLLGEFLAWWKKNQSHYCWVFECYWQRYIEKISHICGIKNFSFQKNIQRYNGICIVLLLRLMDKDVKNVFQFSLIFHA